MPEEDFESKAHVTKHLTGRKFNDTTERTRVNSWPEQDYLNWKTFLGNTLDVDFYKSGSETYMSLKISKDGPSREEDVEVLKGMYGDESKKRNIGYKIWKEAFGGDEKDGSGNGD